MVPASAGRPARRAAHRLGADGAHQQLGAARLHRRRAHRQHRLGDLLLPAHTRFITATRSAIPRMVWVAVSAPTAW